MLNNRSLGDGSFHLINNNPENDFFCSANVNWETHEMMIDSGSPNAKSRIPLGVLWMDDACKLTQKTLGDEELAGKKCVDGQDPKLGEIAGTESFKLFMDYCGKKMDEQGKKFGIDLKSQLTLPRIQIINEVPGDGVFDFSFMSGAYNLACNGNVNSLTHEMVLYSSLYGRKDKDVPNPDGVVELNDACTLTRKAVGEEELVGECKDRTKYERNWETGMEMTWKGLMLGLAARDGYKLIRYGLRRGLSESSLGYLSRGVRAVPGLARTALGGIRSVPGLALRVGSWFRYLNTLGMGGGVAAETTTAAGAGTAVAGGGGTTAAGAGIGAAGTAGLYLAAFAAGVGVGYLIENVPRWCGAKRSVSDGIAWGIDTGVGVAAWNVAFVTGKNTDDVKAAITHANIEILDHMGFGGWNVFKQSWGI